MITDSKYFFHAIIQAALPILTFQCLYFISPYLDFSLRF